MRIWERATETLSTRPQILVTSEENLSHLFRHVKSWNYAHVQVTTQDAIGPTMVNTRIGPLSFIAHSPRIGFVEP